jgi:hypothetical protein
VPVEAGILYTLFGKLLSPMIASAVMSMSSVLVIASALLAAGYFQFYSAEFLAVNIAARRIARL